MNKKKLSSRQSSISADRQNAMPDVKRIVKKHGRTAVIWCINQLREYEKKVKQLEQLRRDAKKLEEEIR